MGEENAIAEWEEAVNEIARTLNKIKSESNSRDYDYAVIGSGAYVLHGVTYENQDDNPADIDITTTNPRATREAILALHKAGDILAAEQKNSSLTVNKFLITFKNGKTFEFEFTHIEDFGFSATSIETINHTQVTSLMETLLSIYLRPEHRSKDHIAFRELIKNNIEDLKSLLELPQYRNEQFKKAIKTMMGIFSDPNTANNPEVIKDALAKILPRVGTKKEVKAAHPIITATATATPATATKPATATATSTKTAPKTKTLPTSAKYNKFQPQKKSGRQESIANDTESQTKRKTHSK